MGDEESAPPQDIPKISKRRKLLYTLSTCIIVFAIGFMLLIVFWLVYPYKTADLEAPVEILNKNHEVTIGDNIILKVRATKYSNVAPTRSEFIICDDGSLTFMEPGTTKNLPIGTYTITNDYNIVPQKLSVGSSCRYHFRYGYKVNPIREIVKEWVSDSFLIIPGGDESAG